MHTDKLVVTGVKEKLLIGSDFHVLQDKTGQTFRTNRVEDFIRSLDGKKDFHVLLSPDQLTANPVEVDRYSVPISTCSLADSEALATLRGMRNQTITFQRFTELMEQLKRFGDATTLDFISQLRAFKLKKILSIESSKETNGDFSYRMALEKGSNDFEPPSKLVFNVPVFSSIPSPMRLEFDLHFIVDQENMAKLAFLLKSYSFDDDVEKEQQGIINSMLDKVDAPKYWGAIEKSVKDDSWSYKANPEQSK